MARVTDWVKREFWTGYSVAERIYLLAMLALQIIVFCIVPDTPLAIIAGISGVISVVLCAKGKVTFYFIGFVQTISYLFLAWEARFYGEVLENIFYLVTMVWGIFVWKANMYENDDGTRDVQAKKFTPLQWFLSVVGTAAATIIMGAWLESIGSQQAYTDAATNVLAIFAQLLMVRRYREQWIWWLVIDVLCLKMWFVDGNWSMVAMYVAWIVNCIYGWYTWTRLNKKPLIEDGVICPTHKAGDEIMDERERLIKLLDECIEAEYPWDHNGPIADHLLHHGVLVFPCNVGTPVYALSPDKQHYYKTRAFPLATLAKWVQNGDFGKCVFLTREEAEAALAERRKA